MRSAAAADAVTTVRLAGAAASRAHRLPPPSGAPPFLGTDPAVDHLRDTVRRLAAGECPVLLLGETGTGKELLARLLHEASPRAAGPFVAVNAAALPDALLEGELFGHARGAFTGALEGREGLVEASGGGTLFLDEVGDLAPRAQAALLRALEERRVRRLGETRERDVDCRLVTATHRDLDAMVRSGAFRADLRFRLGRSVRIPPLRERPADIDVLARAFLLDLAAGGVPAVLDDGAWEALRAHPFPGNARELRTMIEAAAALAGGGVIAREHLGLPEPSRDALAPREAMPLPPEDRLAAVLRRDGASQARPLAEAAGLPLRTAQRALAHLVSEGLALRRGSGCRVVYLDRLRAREEGLIPAGPSRGIAVAPPAQGSRPTTAAPWPIGAALHDRRPIPPPPPTGT
jgi:DNA-binding NtrC family response regulator